MSLPIRLDAAAPLGEIILNRPERRNALSVDMWSAIPGLVAEANANPDIKVILLHGGEAGAFAAGADISEFESIYATEASARASGQRIAEALDAIETSEKPVIAAIEGACVGGGVSLAMAADLRIAGAAAKFGVTPGKLGLVYPAGDTRRLLAAIGPGATKDILFTGRIFSAEDALTIRMIDRMVDTGSALAAARAWAMDIAGISQWSVRATKRMIRGLQSGWTEETEAAQALFLQGFANEDFQEGYRAFLAKRPAAFTFR
ncbi:enoyl-CoA hydratase/isomerase family protein [Hyphomonas sp.]|uniref:enoyl-CoA hydratase/isomerase family protein n=1 Tax=Hyphomonas sp. TaxID=87 RepID=UPI00391BD06C